MGETFTVVFKNGEILFVQYPKDGRNPFKLWKMSSATIGNVIEVQGDGPIARTLRVRYGLSKEKELSTFEQIQQTTGLTKENILKQKDKILLELEKWKRH